MTTSYTEPLGAAYQRMKWALFRPFDLGKWFAVGFASWIAGWGAGGGSNYSFRVPTGWNAESNSMLKNGFDSALESLRQFLANPFWLVGLVAAIVFIVALGLVLLWVISRGEFVFLDAVLNGRRNIAEPWRVWKAQGDSLFVWRVMFGLIMLAAFATVSIIILFLACGGRIPRSFDEVPWLWLAIGFVVAWLPFALAAAYAQLFLRHFVTPIMYRDRSTTSQAWRTFLPILRERLGAFVVYGLFLVVVYIGLLIALIPAIILTCCVLGCLLLIPFISAVVWLPVSYTIRAFGPEFLAQFGDAYNVWPVPAVAAEPPPEIAG